jgi:hypothetical protein
MKDSLGEFIGRNRDEFDQRQPSENAWKAIESSLPEMKQRSLWNSLTAWRVAALVLLGLSIFLFISRPNESVGRKQLAQMQKDFSDQEMFYSDQIADKVALIDDFDNAYEDDHFTQDVQKLDAMYQVLRDEMKSQPSAQVRDALILNMLIRIDLLNQQIKRLEDANKKKQSKEATI